MGQKFASQIKLAKRSDFKPKERDNRFLDMLI
jgi:hypothetical protein